MLGTVFSAFDLTIVIIEHDIPLVMSMSGRVIAMESGRIICSGTPDEVRNDPRVIEAYLGRSTGAIERSGTRSGRHGALATTGDPSS